MQARLAAHRRMRARDIERLIDKASSKVRDQYRERTGQDVAPAIDISGTIRAASELTPEEESVVSAAIFRVLLEVGVPPEFLYGYVRCGAMVSQSNQAELPAEVVEQWENAMLDWQAMGPNERATIVSAIRDACGAS